MEKEIMEIGFFHRELMHNTQHKRINIEEGATRN
jgi:hypothetical protein